MLITAEADLGGRPEDVATAIPTSDVPDRVIGIEGGDQDRRLGTEADVRGLRPATEAVERAVVLNVVRI